MLWNERSDAQNYNMPVNLKLREGGGRGGGLYTKGCWQYQTDHTLILSIWQGYN